MLLSLPMKCFLKIQYLKSKETLFNGHMLKGIPGTESPGRNIHQDMKTKGKIGLRIGLFAPTMKLHPQVRSKAVHPAQLVTGGEAPTLPGPLEAGVAGGSDCLCSGSRLSNFWQV